MEPTSSAKKLVQARLPFLSTGEPPRKKLAYASENDSIPVVTLTDEMDGVCPKRPGEDNNAVDTKRSKMDEGEEITLDDDVEQVKVEVKKKPKRTKAEREMEAERRREERERRRLEKEKEREERQRQKEEKELMRKREEEAKRKAKEEKERKRQMEIELKNEEKRRKEEELQKRKEEEAQAKKKYAKEAAVFTNFFTKVEPGKKQDNPEKIITFKPFAVKNRMRLAPINRNPMDETRRKALDNFLTSQNVFETYVTQLRCGDIVPGRSPNTWPLDQIFQDEDPEVEELPLEPISSQTTKTTFPRPKLLQFHDNRRPPYWGTWRKKCPEVGPRRPLGHYKNFDYEVDSDEEWEEEEPGESLHGSDDEREKEEDGDDYEVDNDFFVPHGYLSADEELDENWSVEQQKEKLKLLGEQFDQERNEKTRQLRPVVIGCIWEGDEIDNPKILAILERCRPWLGEEVKYPLVIGVEEVCQDGDDTSSPHSVKRAPFPDEAVPELIARVHGSRQRRIAIAKEFSAWWAQEHPNAPILSIASVSRKVKELAQWIDAPESPIHRQCWFVPKEIREEKGCGDLPLPSPTSKDIPSSDVDKAAKITKFTKVMTEEERRRSLQNKAIIPDMKIKESVPSPIVEKAMQKLSRFKAYTSRKRVPILFSSPLGTEIKKSAEPSPVDTSTPIEAPEIICLESDESVEYLGTKAKDTGGEMSVKSSVKEAGEEMSVGSPLENDSPMVKDTGDEMSVNGENNSPVVKDTGGEMSLNGLVENKSAVAKATGDEMSVNGENNSPVVKVTGDEMSVPKFESPVVKAAGDEMSVSDTFDFSLAMDTGDEMSVSNEIGLPMVKATGVEKSA